jgi:hypothetical protein
MSPDGPHPSATRRAWRAISALGCVLGAVSILITAVKWTHADVRQDRQASVTAGIQAGRREGQKATCAALGAVIDAGRATITAGIPKPGSPLTPFERSLRRLGYPPRAQRRTVAERAARQYGLAIAVAVERETGRKGLVRRDGTLNCEALARATGTTKQQ